VYLQHDEREEHGVAKVGAGLGRGEDARGVDVGEHDDPGWTQGAQQAPDCRPRSLPGERTNLGCDRASCGRDVHVLSET
jgi:hypothetical protein